MSVCPYTQGYVIHGIYEAFENATKALEEGKTTLANFYLEKIVQKLSSLSCTRLLREETARMLAHELAEKIRELDLNFSKTTIAALEKVVS